MNESRVFMLNGTEVSGIVTRLENFFRTEKGCMAAGDHRRNGCIQTEKVTRRGVSGHRNYHYDRRPACGCDRRGSDGGCGNDRVSELQSAAHRRL